MAITRALRALVGFAFVTALLLTGYGTVIALAPLPPLTPVLTTDEFEVLHADTDAAHQVIESESLPTGFGWHDDTEVWVTDQAVHPLASITKLVVALVGQEIAPIQPDEPAYTWGWDDLQSQTELIELGAVTLPIPLGAEFSREELLRGALIPSANDLMMAYAHATFGDAESIVAATRDWALRHGFSSLTIVEPTGLDARNSATLTDVLGIARLALDDPLIAEIVQQTETVLPHIGAVETTNPLLGIDPRVIGLKTGLLFASGYNLVFAASVEAEGRELTAVAVTLGRESETHRAASSRALLDRIEALPATVAFDEQRVVGFVETWDGRSIDLLSEASPSFTLVPGEQATRETILSPEVSEAAAGTPLGTTRVVTPNSSITQEVTISAEITRPGYWWKFMNPGRILIKAS